MGAADLSRPLADPGGTTELVAQLPAIVWESDARCERFTYVSPRARDLLGHDPDAWRDTPDFWAAHLHPDDRDRVLAAIERASRQGGTVRLRYRFRDAGGDFHWFQDTIAVNVGQGRPAHLAGMMLDVTEDQGELESIAAGAIAAAAVEARSGPLHATIVDNLQDGVYYVDLDRRISYWNRGAERMTGHRATEVVGRYCYDNLLCHVDAVGRNLCHDGCPLETTMADGITRQLLVWYRHVDGSRRPVQVRTAPIRAADGSIIGGVEIFNDATGLVEARDAAEAARREALTDPLTGLPNRRLLDVVLASRQDELDRLGTPYAFLLADIDRFKAFNDRYGHDVGDEALRVVAATLRGGVRGGDALVRWGGEEFGIVAAIRDEDSVHRLADRLLRLMRAAQVRAGGRVVPVRVSVGGAIARPDESAARLFVRADGALRSAKASGRDRFVLAGVLEPEAVAEA